MWMRDHRVITRISDELGIYLKEAVLERVDMQGFDAPQVIDGRFASVDDTPSSLGISNPFALYTSNVSWS